VFTTGLGTAIEPGNLTRSWSKVLAAAGVGQVAGMTCATRTRLSCCNRASIRRVVSERMGHASVAITLNVYSHVLPGLEASAAAALDVLLASPEPKADAG
jgi:integrase